MPKTKTADILNHVMPNSIQYLILLVILGVLSVFFYHDIITLFPAYNHAWTQSDKLALVHGFLDNHFQLFKPQTSNLITKGGITGVDLALHEYVVAIIMKVLGTKNPMIFRVYNLMLGWIGYVYLFQLSKLINQSFIKSILVVVFAFTLPILSYYQAGFLPSTTALATAFISYYYYFSFRKSKKELDFFLALFFMLLSSLVRTPYNIFLFALLLEHIYYWIKNHSFRGKELLGFGVVYLLIIASNLYKIYLNRTYGSIFLNSLTPPDSIEQLVELTKLIWKKWYLELMTVFHYALLGISLIGLMIYSIKKELRTNSQSLVFRQSILILLGGMTFFIIMIRQFIDHEYYYIDSFYLGIILLFIAGLSGLTERIKIIRVAQPVIGILLLVGATWGSKNIQKLKNELTIGGRGETTTYNYSGADVFLDSLGIARSATILVLDGYSPNGPLLLMDRKGYCMVTTESEEVKSVLKKEFDYLVQQKDYFLSDVLEDNPYLIPRLKRIASNGKITVFKLQDPDKTQHVWNLLTDKEPILTSTIDLESGDPTEGWHNTLDMTDQVVFEGDYSGLLTEAFGPTFIWEDHYLNFTTIVFEGQFNTTKNCNPSIITVFYVGDQEVETITNPIKIKHEFLWTKQQYQIKLPTDKGVISKVKIFLWNPAHETVYFDNIILTLF